MQLKENNYLLSASDLSLFMGCHHATSLEKLRAAGKLSLPVYQDLSLTALIKRGEDFEQEYIETLKAESLSVRSIVKDSTAVAETIKAMEEGVDVIYQARLEHEIWIGWADFLIKVDTPSKFGNWSYEVVDTKLARHTRAGAILQICLYSEILEKFQGSPPEKMHIRNPDGQQSFRVNDYLAYYRLMKKKLVEAIIKKEDDTYPDPVPQCDICKWWAICDKKRRDDDHLSFIAGMGSLHQREVKAWGVKTLESMALLAPEIPFKPTRGSIETFRKLREQARLQKQSREEKRLVYELLEPVKDCGFFKLPAPSEGDMFFDFEGDPFVGTSGREYLFGWVYQEKYECLWAESEADEKKAFEDFIDRVMKILDEHPDMHIYHFASYEPSALKRLMGKYGTRENEVDRLLRGERFVDLHSITRNALRAGVESYSLKELEKLHSFLRTRDLKLVVKHKMLYENLLETNNIELVETETRDIVRDYNMDDCLSTESLRNWLEDRRDELINSGNEIPRPEIQEEEANENIKEFQERIRPLYEALMLDLPVERENRNDEEQGKWLLANMLDWYRREKKSYWWEYFRMKNLSADELFEEKTALSGLSYTGKREMEKRSIVDYYSFPPQEYELENGLGAEYEERIGTIFSIDHEKRIVGIKKNSQSASIHPSYLIFREKDIENKVKEEAIIRLAEWMIENGVNANGSYRAGRDLLTRNVPETLKEIDQNLPAQDLAKAWLKELDHSVLPVQGPPGSGKSYTAAKMILQCLQEGKKVGITALSHKVICALLQKVNEEAKRQKFEVKMAQKVNTVLDAEWIECKDNGEPLELLTTGQVQVVAGTTFLWAREEFFESVDVLFVDEAGQLSLIDTLAISQAAKNMVLLGDPRQLQQPQKGSHPEGTEVSALQHVLGDHQTLPKDKGVFLDSTWRMHPAICNYVSELFYEGRLEAREENSLQTLKGKTRYNQPGIYFEEVVHHGNQNGSVEEVERVHEIVKDLLSGSTKWINVNGKEQPLMKEHIKVIAPYNVQVNDLKSFLGDIEVGTVDKFQGQEAPVIICSLATSSPEDAPRGMEFLYSLNRLNVAVSRARAVFILAASPALFEPTCRSPRQMQLANALCRLKEIAR